MKSLAWVWVAVVWLSACGAEGLGQTFVLRRGTPGHVNIGFSSPVPGTFAANISSNLVDWSGDLPFQVQPGMEGKDWTYFPSPKAMSFFRWRWIPWPEFTPLPASLTVREGEPFSLTGRVLSEEAQEVKWWQEREGGGYAAQCCFTNSTLAFARAERWMEGAWALGASVGGALIFSEPCRVTVLPAEKPPVSAGEAPESIAGMRFRLSIRRGARPFATFGSYTFEAARSGNDYWVDSALFSSTGTYSYRKTGVKTAVIEFADSLVGAGVSQTLNFESATRGSYRLEKEGSAGFQEGTFTVLE